LQHHVVSLAPPTAADAADPLLDALATAVIRLDGNLRLQSLNAAAEQLLGISARRAVGERLTRLVTVPDPLFTRLRDAIPNDRPWTERQVSIEPHGREPLLVDCVASPLRPNDEPAGLVLELYAVDRASRIARDEAMKVQQEHARSLLRGLAHEIKNPLGGLRGAAQLLDRQLHDPDLRDYTSVIIRESDRLQGLIDRMLGPVGRPRAERVNLHEVLEHVRTIATVGAPSGIALQIDYDPSIPECLTDRDRLVQVLLNVVGNALNALGKRGAITFRSRVHGNFTIGGRRHHLVASLEVHDDGPGVPPPLIDQIFYPMVTGTEHGTGLGLSIAQSTMNQLGGLIECRSEPGDTVFTVFVPIVLPPDEPPSDIAPESASALPPSPTPAA